jgi:hypothetical protein
MWNFFTSSCPHLEACSRFWSMGLISQFLDHSQTVGLLGRVISWSQGLYLNTGKLTHTSNVHALSGIKIHDPGFQASEDCSATVTGKFGLVS